MAAPYSTVTDLRAHWPDLPEESEPEATQKITEASIEIRGLYPDLDSRIAAGDLDPEVPKLVVNRMVKRAMNTATSSGLDGISAVTNSTGPFSQAMTFSNPDGSIYPSAADKRLLRPNRSTRKAWTIQPTTGRP